MNLKSKLPLLFVLCIMGIAYYLDLTQYLSFEALREHREELLAWTDTHFFVASLIFCCVYIIAVALSIPGAIFLTLAGGFMFGVFWGSLYVVVSATIGATILFIIVKIAFSDSLLKKKSAWVDKMRGGFNENSFSYLLILRLIPLFPFFIVNIVPALLNVTFQIYVTATIIGIIPATVVYVMVGNGLGHVFAIGQTPNLSTIFEPQILLPLCGLALLALLPVLYKKK